MKGLGLQAVVLGLSSTDAKLVKLIESWMTRGDCCNRDREHDTYGKFHIPCCKYPYNRVYKQAFLLLSATVFLKAYHFHPESDYIMEYPAHTGYNFTQTLHNDIYPSIDPSKSDLSQPGKVVLITGSGRGLGRAIALRFAECGVACVVVCARTALELNEVEQGIYNINGHVRVRKFTIDVTDELAVLAVAQTVRDQEGRLDVLVNNAAILDKYATITDRDSELYMKTLDVNIKGPYLMLKVKVNSISSADQSTNISQGISPADDRDGKES